MVNEMNFVHILKIIGAAIVFLIVNVLASVLVVAVYAYLIAPGQPSGFYEEFAEFSAPYSSVFAGMPLMFAWCWWLASKWNFKSIVGIWIVYAIIDITILSISGWTARLALFSSVSLLTKLAAAVLGAKLGARNKPA